MKKATATGLQKTLIAPGVYLHLGKSTAIVEAYDMVAIKSLTPENKAKIDLLINQAQNPATIPNDLQLN